ncbi:MAG: hypothetical protein AAFY56_17040 [Pseudomonadota bacterium]
MTYKHHKSHALAAVHETALGLRDAGVITKQTMSALDETCLMPVEDLHPEKIQHHVNASQTGTKKMSKKSG